MVWSPAYRKSRGIPGVELDCTVELLDVACSKHSDCSKAMSRVLVLPTKFCLALAVWISEVRSVAPAGDQGKRLDLSRGWVEIDVVYCTQ